AGSGGAWSITGADVSSLADGPLTVTVTATDAAGNVSVASDSVMTTKDTVAPGKPSIAGVNASVNIADVASITVSGSAEDSASVAIRASDGTHHVDATVSADGTTGAWSKTSFDLSSLSDGTITFTAVATDAAGNASPTSDGVARTKDTVAPA